jgi:tripartite-type tricarboxylate transporter receptor subunit TctC
LGLWLAAWSGQAAAQTSAQSWPTRTVKFILPLGPGSGADVGARLLADRLSPRWGQSVVVENRTGGDGMIAINAFIGARDDHTLLYAPTSTFTAHPYQHEKLPYDPRELFPLVRVTNTLVGFAVSPSLPVASVADFVALIRAQPGKINYATGTGMTDLIYEGYFRSAGLAVTRVSYRDTVTPMTDVSEGRIQAYVAGLANMQAQAQAGRAKLIAVTNTRRAPTWPNLPTVTEAGFPALTFDGLIGIFCPRDMAAASRNRIADDVRATLADPAVVERLTSMGALVSPGDGAEFAASIEEQRAKLAEIAKVLGIKRAGE